MESEPQATSKSQAGFFCPAYVGLRCFLVMLVMEGHYWFEKFPTRGFSMFSFAVPCFFALSGFLISHTLFSYEEAGVPWKKGMKVFYMRRLLRILPPFVLVLAVAHLVRGVPHLVWHATYLTNIKVFLLSAFDPLAWREYLAVRYFNAIHFWSVAVEEQFYLVYPFLVFMVPRKYRTAMFGFGIVTAIAFRVYCWTHFRHAFYGGLPIIAGEFIMWGCLVAWMDHRDRWTWLRTPLALYGSLAVFFLLAVNETRYGNWGQWKAPPHQTVYCILLAVFILSLRYSGETVLARVIAWKPFAFVGKLSYGAYLIQEFLNPYLDPILERFPFLVVFPACPRAVLGPICTIALATVMWYCWEEPINRWRTRWRIDK